jgi:hypothetical protein
MLPELHGIARVLIGRNGGAAYADRSGGLEQLD